MNRYNLEHRKETEVTDKLPAYMAAVAKVGLLFHKVNQAIKYSEIEILHKITIIDPLPHLVDLEDRKIGIAFRIRSQQYTDMPEMTMSLPIERVIGETHIELAKTIREQTYGSLVMWTKIEGEKYPDNDWANARLGDAKKSGPFTGPQPMRLMDEDF